MENGAWPNPFNTYHSDTYPAISPSLPSLSTTGKNIVITGGGSGIGPEIARSFAVSGAASISLLGRTESTLIATKLKLETEFPKTRFLIFVDDIADREATFAAFEGIKAVIGKIDVLIANAGFLAKPAMLVDVEVEEWYKGFDINVKGNINLINAFLLNAAEGAAVIHMSTAVAHFPMVPKGSSYHASKLAAAKLFDYLHYEHPELFVLNVSPGSIDTAMAAKSASGGVTYPFDSVQLPADFAVWAVSKEASFLNGKFVWAQWDVEEMKANRERIEGHSNLNLGLI